LAGGMKKREPNMSDRVEYIQNASDMQYQDRVDIKVIFNNQVQRCLISIGTEYFPETVEALACLLPMTSYEKVMNRREEWVMNVEEFEYKYGGPVRLGSPEKPLMMKRPNSEIRYPIPYKKDEDGNQVIDWDDPHIMSPKLVTKEKEDQMLQLRFILDAAEYAGLLWPKQGHRRKSI